MPVASDRPVNAGNPRSLTDTFTRLLTCAWTGPSIAAYVLLSWWSYFPALGPGGWPGTPRRYVSAGSRVRDDLVAQVDAFNANRHAGNADQHVDLRLRFAAESAFRVVAIHRRFPFIAIWHHYQRTGGPQQLRPAVQPAPDPVAGLGQRTEQYMMSGRAGSHAGSHADERHCGSPDLPEQRAGTRPR